MATASSAIASEFNVGARAQTQGLTYAARFDSISGTGRDPLSLYRDIGADDGTNEQRLATGDSLPLAFPSVLTLTINAGATGYNDATLVLTGGTNAVQYAGVDLSAFNTFFLGFESNGTSSHKVDSVSLVALPEPSAYGLLGAGALAAVAVVRRRRKIAVGA